MHMLGGVWGHAPPEKLGALRSLLRPYLYSMPLEYIAMLHGSGSLVCHMSDVGISVDWSQASKVQSRRLVAVKHKSIACAECLKGGGGGSVAYDEAIA